MIYYLRNTNEMFRSTPLWVFIGHIELKKLCNMKKNIKSTINKNKEMRIDQRESIWLIKTQSKDSIYVQRIINHLKFFILTSTFARLLALDLSTQWINVDFLSCTFILIFYTKEYTVIH